MWIRMDAGITDDPRIWALADAIRKDVGATIGYVMCLLRKLPEQARDGDLSHVPDAMLEQWAMWPGKRGVFATAFVSEMCEGRRVRAWMKHNGAPLKELDDKRAAMSARRAAERAARLAGAESPTGTPTPSPTTPERAANVPPTVTPTVPPTVRNRSALTVRNETKRNETKPRTTSDADASDAGAGPDLDLRSGASADAPPADPPAWLVLHAEWEKRVGPVDKGRFRKAFRPVCEPEPRYPVVLLRRAIEWYAARKRNTREWAFVKPEAFVGGIREHLDVAEMDADDRVRLLPLPAGAA